MTDVRRPAVFLDRDGTLNVEVEYLHRIENFEWIPGAPEAVRRLNALDVPVLVVTNQAGVAHGHYSEEEVERLHAFMQEELAKRDSRIDAFYYCPYHPDGKVPEYRKQSACRKPNPGMFEQAIQEWGVAPARSFVIGDKNTDLIPGNSLDMTTVRVQTGYGSQEADDAVPDHVVPDVRAAVDLIEREYRGRKGAKGPSRTE